MIGQFLTRIKLGLGFGLGFSLLYLSRADFYRWFVVDRYYTPMSGDYSTLTKFIAATGELLSRNSIDYLLFSDILIPLNTLAFVLFVVTRGRIQTLLWRLQIWLFLFLDLALVYVGFTDPLRDFRVIDAYVVFNYLLPIALGIYLLFLLERIWLQLTSDELDLKRLVGSNL